MAGNYTNCSTATLYSWNFGDGSSPVTVPSPCHTYTSAGTYNVSLTTSNPCGSSTFTKQVCITAAATSSFTIDNNKGCAPLTVNATNTSNTLSGCVPATYQWTVSYLPSNCGAGSGWAFSVGTTASSTNPSFDFTNPGTYTISLAVTNPCGTVTSAKTVSVKNPPTVTLSSIPNSCGPATVNPSATVTNCGTGTETYLWTFENGNQTTSTNLDPGNVTFTSAGSHLITLAATNECVTTSNTQTVFINLPPNVITPSNQSICPGTSVPSVNFAGTLAGTVYSWTNSNTAIGLTAGGNTSAIPSFNASNNTATAQTATITLNAIANGCTTQSSFIITVNPNPTVPVVSSPVNYCQML